MADHAEPIVSVIIPAFNRERFVGEAIDSVLAQGTPLELIVVDDGSTDGTATVVQQYGNAVRYHHQENRGISAARNAGVALAACRLLAFLDSDDVWTSDKLPRQLAALEADPQLEAVFGHAEQFYDASVDEAFRSRHPIKVQNGPATLSTAMLIRREAFERVGPFDASVDFGVDVDWYLRAREIGLRTEILPEVVYRRRLHADNVGRTNSAEANLARLRALRRSLDRRRAGPARTTTASPPRTQGSKS